MEDTIYSSSTPWALFHQKWCVAPDFFVLISSHCSTQIWRIRYGGSWSIYFLVRKTRDFKDNFERQIFKILFLKVIVSYRAFFVLFCRVNRDFISKCQPFHLKCFMSSFKFYLLWVTLYNKVSVGNKYEGGWDIV